MAERQGTDGLETVGASLLPLTPLTYLSPLDRPAAGQGA